MTVITKPITEKKAEKQEQPLVTTVLPDGDIEKGGEKYSGSGPVPLPNYLAPWNPPRNKRQGAIPTLCLLLLALLVMSVGIITGLYVYRQFARPSNMRYNFRGSCPIPFDERFMASGYTGGSDLQQLPEDPHSLEELSIIQDLQNELRKAMSGEMYESNGQKELQEDVEIGGENYEKITVPDLYGTDKNQFIHDFSVNITGIVDITRRHCFIMPLNRTQILPPKDLMDLVKKMWRGDYVLNSDVVRETMRVVLPAVEKRDKLGDYIQRECDGYPIYWLEKIVSGVTKRSIQGKPTQFVSFAGNTNVLSILNMDQLADYEKSLR